MKSSTRRPREKRPNGEGGIWFSESEGRWRAQYADQHGKTRSLSSKTEAEVTRRLNKAIADRDAGILGGLPSMTPTIGEWLDHWLESRDDLKPRSRERYEFDIRKRLKPMLGSTRLDKATPVQIEAAYRKLREDLSASTVAHVHSVLRCAYKEAYRVGLVTTNVMGRVRPPKVVRTEVVPMSLDEAKRVLDAARAHGPMAYARWALALRWGPRQGEALGLRWSDVDLKSGKVWIRQAVQRQKGKGLVFVTPKSRAGRRSFTLDEGTRNALVTWRRAQAEIRLASDHWADHDLIFTTREGGPVERGNDGRQWKKLLADAGVGSFRVHDARHTAATYLLEVGVSERRVMEILGHSQIGLTMNTYAHVTDRSLCDAAARVSALYGVESESDSEAMKVGEV